MDQGGELFRNEKKIWMLKRAMLKRCFEHGGDKKLNIVFSKWKDPIGGFLSAKKTLFLLFLIKVWK